jgi:hypothetical protein
MDSQWHDSWKLLSDHLAYTIHLLLFQCRFSSFMVSPLAHIRNYPSIKATMKPLFYRDDMESRFFVKLGT